MTKIERDIAQAREAFETWPDDKAKFAEEFQYKDFEAMEDASQAMISVISTIIDIFYYNPDEFQAGNDYRTLSKIQNKAIMLKSTLGSVQESIDRLNIPDFQKRIEKAETLIISLIKSAEAVRDKKERRKEIERSKRVGKTNRRKTQQQNWDEWKEWVDRERGETDPYDDSESEVFKLHKLLTQDIEIVK